jgi:hypothetical protein
MILLKFEVITSKSPNLQGEKEVKGVYGMLLPLDGHKIIIKAKFCSPR